jgi:hypothetical protein
MTTKKQTAGFQSLALSSIHESNTNPRRTFDESKLAELAESLRSQGLIQPITVRPNSEGYEIVAGARRFRAAHLAEMDEVPVRIVQLSDEQAIEWQLIELSIVVKRFLLFMMGRTSFLCKRCAGPRIDAPRLGASRDRENLPQSPFFANRPRHANMEREFRHE